MKILNNLLNKFKDAMSFLKYILYTEYESIIMAMLLTAVMFVGIEMFLGESIAIVYSTLLTLFMFWCCNIKTPKKTRFLGVIIGILVSLLFMI